jgi:hypothetical protein
MDRIIELMAHKNHFLENFYSTNEKQLAELTQGEYNNLENFYETRESLIESIRYLDSEIGKELDIELELGADPDPSLVAADIRNQVIDHLKIKNMYVTRILDLDLQIISQIEKIKSSIIKDLADVQKHRKSIGGYKSPNFHRRVNSEA